jgi:hypothetical protein
VTLSALIRSRRDLTIVGTVVAWIIIVLGLDAGTSIRLQRVIGAATWLILIVLLLR